MSSIIYQYRIERLFFLLATVVKFLFNDKMTKDGLKKLMS